MLTAIARRYAQRTAYRPSIHVRPIPFYRPFAQVARPSEIPRSAVDYETKYSEKLRQLAKKEGLSVDQLKNQRLTRSPAPAAKAATPKAQRAPAATEATAETPKAQRAPAAKKAAATTPMQTPFGSSAPTLDKIVKIELLENEDIDTITKIWTQYHADKDCITAVIPSAMYDSLYRRSQQYPMFVVPMPRESGVEFFFMQFNFHQCNFTSLLEYKTKGSEARPFLTISHFPELSKSKGIVLMKGEISDNPRMIDTQNAQFLAFALQQFYATGNETKLKLVEHFHKAPHAFDYQELIREMENV